MSSTITVTFGPHDEGVRRKNWEPWATRNGLVLNRGNNLLYRGVVEVDYRTKREMTFSTYWNGPALCEVVDLALRFWVEFGGAMSASPELAQLIVGAASIGLVLPRQET